jgi:septal ring factor EnvC (AmiA/AmiB activator)
MQRRNGLWVLAFMAVLLAGAVLFFLLDVPAAYARCWEQWRQIQQMKQSNAEMARQIQEQWERLRRLQEDPSEQELYLRQRQKRVRPGEKIFVLPSEPTH